MVQVLSILLKMFYIMEILHSCLEKVGERSKVLIGSMLETSIDHVEMMVQADRGHVGAFSREL